MRLALGECRHWLEGLTIPFVEWTDHENLEYIRSAKQLNARKARWALFLHFDFILSFRPGSKNGKPDALSRRFASLGDSPPSDTILPPGRVVGRSPGELMFAFSEPILVSRCFPPWLTFLPDF